MNFYGFSGSHKAMRIIHLNTVTKLYHRFMTWYSISPPFKRSCTHSSLLGTFLSPPWKKENPNFSFPTPFPRSVIPLRCGQVEMPPLTKVWMPHLWESLLPRGKITANFPQPLPIPLERSFCLIDVCLHWAVYSPNVNCVTTMYPTVCQAWLSFWSCHGLPFCEEARREKTLLILEGLQINFMCIVLFDYVHDLHHFQNHLTLNMVQLKCPWVLSGTQEYGWAPLGVWLWIQSFCSVEKETRSPKQFSFWK